MSEEPLVYMPLEKWCELQKVFKADWPRSVSGYTVLETQRQLIERGFDYGFKVYCPFGDVRNGMVAINIKDEAYEVIIQCPRDDTDKLEDALKRTKLVDWQRSLMVPYAPRHIIECVQKVLKDFKVDLLFSDTFALEDPAVFEDVSLSPNVTFGLVLPEDLELVDSTWPHRYPTSAWYFKLLIDIKSGYGLYKDNNLIVWVFFNESGNLHHLYTIESERRKGYAELLLKLTSKILCKEGRPMVAFCLHDNVNAFKFYNKIGFKKWHKIAWCLKNK